MTMEQKEIILSMNQEMENDNQTKSVDDQETRVIVKQEANDDGMEVEQNLSTNEPVPVIIDSVDFVEFHNQQIKMLEDQLSYVTKCFDVMYKYKNVCDLIVEDYFQSDESFRYKDIIETLESDLYGVIAEDENQYQSLLNQINTEITLNDENQFEFVESDLLTEDEESELQSPEASKIVQIVNGVDNGTVAGGTTSIGRLPGQKTAPAPECPACGYKARCRLKLEAHLSEHEDNPLVVCNHDGCEVTYNLHELSRHEKDYHQNVSLICEMCNEMFDTKSMLVQHYKLHIKKKEKIKCNFPGCNYTDIYTGRMDRHKKMVHNIEITKQFKCDYNGCGRIFKDRPSFYTHSLIHKDRSLVYKHKCTVDNCGAVFKRRRNLALHMFKHGALKRRFSCNISNCKRVYTREKELHRHIQQCHKDVTVDTSHLNDSSIHNDLDTSNDGDQTKSESDLTATTIKTELQDEANIIYVQSLEHNAEDGTVNVICGGDENSNTQMNEDMITDENTPNDSKVIMVVNKSSDDDTQQMEYVSGDMDDPCLDTVCELCSVTFTSKDDLIMHLKDRHHQYTVKAYHCDFQGCKFATHFRSILGKHKNDVHGGKYRCDVCGKLSKDSGNHNRHRNIHKNVLFRCRYENCDAVYKSPKAYYVHVLTHSNEQPVYTCDFPNCKYVTYYMNTLNVHKLTHSDVRKFFCPYENCGKGFKRNGDLNKHITHSHKGVKRPQKKRKLNESQLVYKCTWTNCTFTSTDSDQLSKHEENHAAESVIV